MIKENDTSLSLRQRAETELKRKLLELQNSHNQRINELGESEILKINHELELKKIELELQNEELKNAITKAETSSALYDFSPAGYFTLTKDGTIEHLNISAATMLGEDRTMVCQNNIKAYISKDSIPVFEDFLQKVFYTKSKQVTEILIVNIHKPGTEVSLYIEGIVSNKEKCLLTAVDICKQKGAEYEILKQKQFFEQIFSQSSISTQILDNDGWCIKINPKLSELFGVKAEDIQGKKYNIFKDAALINGGIIPLLEKVFKEGKTAEWDILFDIELAAESQNIEVSNKRKRWFHNWAYPIFDEEGQLSQVIIQHTDITEQKNDVQKLSSSESRYRSLFESAQDGIVILDAGNGNIIDANPHFYELLGQSEDDLINKTFWEIGCFKNESGIKEVFNELQSRGYIRQDNITIETIQGKLLHVEFTGNLCYVDERPVIQCNIRNITENIEAEKEIYTLRTVIEQGPSAIVITNAEGKIGFVNNKYTELTQFTAEDVMGKHPRIFNEGHLPEHQYIDLWDTLKGGKTWEGKFLNRRKDNTYFWEQTSISAVKNPDGSLSNYILIQNDISEKEQIIIDLIQAKEKAEESDILKSAFLANMSHEIRTPLNSIIGFSELMSEPDFDQRQLLHFARIINSSGNKLLSIITDIMDLSRIEAGEIKVDKRKLSVNQLISNIQKEYQFRAMEKGLEIKIDHPHTFNEFFVESDENKLRQILINFIGNAIKFTDKGYLELGIQKNGDLIKIYVKDTGIGIPEQYKNQIFERFRQVESAYSRKYGGNGLGLAISKALIELLGGQIGMETEYGKGSTFYFTLPLSIQ